MDKKSTLHSIIGKAVEVGMGPAQMRDYLYSSKMVEHILCTEELYNHHSMTHPHQYPPGTRYEMQTTRGYFIGRAGNLPQEDIPYLLLMGWTPELIHSTYEKAIAVGISVGGYSNMLVDKQRRRINSGYKKSRYQAEGWYNVFPKSTTIYTTKVGVSYIRVVWSDIRIAMNMTDIQAKEYVRVVAEFTWQRAGLGCPGYSYIHILLALYARTVGEGWIEGEYPVCLWNELGVRGRNSLFDTLNPYTMASGRTAQAIEKIKRNCMSSILLWGAWKLGMYSPTPECAYSILSTVRAAGLLENEDQKELEVLYTEIEYLIGLSESIYTGHFAGYYMDPSRGLGYFREQTAGPFLGRAYNEWPRMLCGLPEGAAMSQAGGQSMQAANTLLGREIIQTGEQHGIERVIETAYRSNSLQFDASIQEGGFRRVPVYDMVGYISITLQEAAWGDLGMYGRLARNLYLLMREQNTDVYEIVSAYLKFLWEEEPYECDEGVSIGIMDFVAARSISLERRGEGEIHRGMSSYLYLLWWIAYRGATEADRSRAQKALGSAGVMKEGKWTAVPMGECWEALMYTQDSSVDWEEQCRSLLDRENSREEGSRDEPLLVAMMCIYSTSVAEDDDETNVAQDQYTTDVMKMLQAMAGVPQSPATSQDGDTGPFSCTVIANYCKLLGILSSECGILPLVHKLLDGMSRRTVLTVAGAGMGGRIPLMRSGIQNSVVWSNLERGNFGYRALVQDILMGEKTVQEVEVRLKRALQDPVIGDDPADGDTGMLYAHEKWDVVLLAQETRRFVYDHAEYLIGSNPSECTLAVALEGLWKFTRKRFPGGISMVEGPKEAVLSMPDGRWGITGMTTLMPSVFRGMQGCRTHIGTSDYGFIRVGGEGPKEQEDSVYVIRKGQSCCTWRILSVDGTGKEETEALKIGIGEGTAEELGRVENILKELEGISPSGGMKEIRLSRTKEILKSMLETAGPEVYARDYEEIIGMTVPEGELWGIDKDKRLCIIGGSMYRNCWAMNYGGISTLIIGRSSLAGLGRRYEEVADNYCRDKWVVLSLPSTQYDGNGNLSQDTKGFEIGRILVVPDEQWDMMVPLMEHGMVLWPEILHHKYLAAWSWPGWNGGWGTTHCYGDWNTNATKYGYGGRGDDNIGWALVGRVLPAPNIDIKMPGVGGIYIPRWYTEHIMNVLKKKVVRKGRAVDALYKGTSARIQVTFRGGFLGRGIISPERAPVGIAIQNLNTLEHVLPLIPCGDTKSERTTRPVCLYRVLRREIGTIPSTYLSCNEIEDIKSGTLIGDNQRLVGIGVQYTEKESMYMLDILQGLYEAGWMEQSNLMFMEEALGGSPGYRRVGTKQATAKIVKDIGIVEGPPLTPKQASDILRWKMWNIVYNRGRGVGASANDDIAYIYGDRRVLSNSRGVPTDNLDGEPNENYAASEMENMAAKIDDQGWLIGKGLKASKPVEERDKEQCQVPSSPTPPVPPPTAASVGAAAPVRRTAARRLPPLTVPPLPPGIRAVRVERVERAAGVEEVDEVDEAEEYEEEWEEDE